MLEKQNQQILSITFQNGEPTSAHLQFDVIEDGERIGAYGKDIPLESLPVGHITALKVVSNYILGDIDNIVTKQKDKQRQLSEQVEARILAQRSRILPQ